MSSNLESIVIRVAVGVILAMFVLALLSIESKAQARCGDRGLIVSQLATAHKERQAALGLTSSSKLIEIWTNPESSSFTLLITMANGNSCLLYSGTMFEQKLIDGFDPKFEF